MGEHKHNPTAIAAKKKGELPPKKPKLSTRQSEALIRAKIDEITGINQLRPYLSNKYI